MNVFKKVFLIAAILCTLAFAIGYTMRVGAAVLRVCTIPEGCTSTSTRPTYGQLLMGDGLGYYTLTSTSSLGITGGGGSSFGEAWAINGQGALIPTTTRGVIVTASSTIGAGTQASGLTINGGATTTGKLTINGQTGNGAFPLNINAVNASGFSNLIQFINSSGVSKWHFTMPSGNDLSYTESGVADNRLYLQAGGNIGINTATPSTMLDVRGGIIGAASSTIGDGSQAGGLTVNGGATTTGQSLLNGRVGIGTLRPLTKLQIDLANTNDFVRVGSTGAGTFGYQISDNLSTGNAVAQLSVNGGSGEVRIGGVATNYFTTLYSNNSEGIRITTGLNVGIGTTSPFVKLSVSGKGYFENDVTASSMNATSSSALKLNNSTIFYASTTIANTFVGPLAGNTTFTQAADSNTAIGYSALSALTSGFGNAAFGREALGGNQTGNSNMAIGREALLKLTGSDSNVAIGYQSLRENLTGDNNIGIGSASLKNNTSYGNVGIGSSAGQSITSGNSNIFIGRDSGNNAAQLTNAVNSIAIGNNAITTVSNQVVLGNNLITRTQLWGNTGIATTSPFARLSVHANPNDAALTTTLFAVASSTGAATTTLFSISNTGTTTAANGFNITAGCYALNGTCISGGSATAVAASTTADFVFYKVSNTYYVYNASSSVTTSNASYATLLTTSANALGAAAGTLPGGQIYHTPGIYYANATTTINGNNQGSTGNAPAIRITGAGTDATNIVVTNNSLWLLLDKYAKPEIDHIGVYLAGGSKAIMATSTDKDARSIWQYSMHDMWFGATTTSTGLPVLLANAFRGQLNNLEFFETNGCIRFVAQGAFNPGDTTGGRFFCEMNTTADAIAYEVRAEGTGFINQMHLDVMEGIATGVRQKFIAGTGINYSEFTGLNSEQFDVMVDATSTFGSEFQFNYATNRDSVAKLRACRFDSNSSGNHCDFKNLNNSASIVVMDDRNSNLDDPNIFSGKIGQDAGAASASTSGATLFRDISGYGTLGSSISANGSFGRYDFQNNINTLGTATSTFVGSVSIGTTTPNSRSFFSVGTSTTRFTVDGITGNVGVGTTSPAGKFAVDGTVYMKSLTTGTVGNFLCLSTDNQVTSGGVACVPSAAKYKNTIVDLPMGSALTTINQLRPVSFYYNDGLLPGNGNQKDGKAQQRLGLIADEVDQVENRLVSYNDEGGVEGLHEEEFKALFVQAIQELDAKIGAGTAVAKKSAEDNWQWLVMLVGFAFCFGFIWRQQVQINRLRNR